MANVIKPKRGDSDPGTDDIADGEIAIRKDVNPPKLFVRVGSSIREIGGGSGGDANQTLTTGNGISGANSGSDGNFTMAVEAAQTTITSIFATDLKIGEDDQTKIDFETVNQIHFYLNNAKDFSMTANTFTAESGSSIVVPDGGLTFGSTAITATGAELNIMDGVTSTTAELNILDGVTSTAAELNILDGVTSTAAELNILDGVTATATELNKIDGYTGTTAELNYLDGTKGTITADHAVVADSSGNINGDNNGTLSNYAISGCSVDNTIVGGSTRAAGYFTGLQMEGALSHVGDTNNSIEFGTDTQTFDTNGTARMTITDTSVAISNILSIASEMQHTGDTNNSIAFGTDTQTFETGGSTRLDLSDSGLRIGGTGARVTQIENNDSLGTSDTKLCTQGNVKAYVDANAGGGSSVSFGSDNQIPVQNSGGDDFDYSSNFTYDGTKLLIQTNDNQAQLELKSTDSDASSGPIIRLTRDGSSAADDDLTGEIEFSNDDSDGTNKQMNAISSKVEDITSNSLDTFLSFKAMKGNTYSTVDIGATGATAAFAMKPGTDNMAYLGSSGKAWQRAYARAYYGYDGSSFTEGATAGINQNLASTGDLVIQTSGGICIALAVLPSDRNVKTDIADYTPTGLDLITKLNGTAKTFKYVDGIDPSNSGKTHTNFIAQDLQAINSNYAVDIPDPRDASKTVLGISETFDKDLQHSLIASIVELKERLEAAEAKIKVLEG